MDRTHNLPFWCERSPFALTSHQSVSQFCLDVYMDYYILSVNPFSRKRFLNNFEEEKKLILNSFNVDSLCYVLYVGKAAPKAISFW